MDEILECLKRNGYQLYNDEIADGYNDYIKIQISFDTEKHRYNVRYAILADFDRWANSGFVERFNTKEEVIEFLEDKTEILSKAISELIYEIVESAFWGGRGDHALIGHLIYTLNEIKNNIE